MEAPFPNHRIVSARGCDTPLALPRREKEQGLMGTRDIISDPGLIEELTGIVSRAAAAILQARAGGLKPRAKPDASPVTVADEASEAVILEGLARVLPGVPVVSEEAGATSELVSGAFVLVDPLAGTRELVAGRDDFCVNLAVVSGGRARLGIIASPVMGLVWRTRATGGAERFRLAPGAVASAASERTTIRTRPWPAIGAVAAVSRSHLNSPTQAFLARLPSLERHASGSAIKLCRVAEGTADVYPRLATVSEWDVAAGDAIVAAAGGGVRTHDGAPLSYGHNGFLVPGFVAWGDLTAPARLGLAKD